MGRRVTLISKHSPVGCNAIELIEVNPKLSDLLYHRLKEENSGGSNSCMCKILGRWLSRGESPNKLSDSWFSTKSIKVERY